MVTLTFVFNRDKVKANGLTEEELLRPMRDHAKKYDIDEIELGVFAKDGEDALCDISMFIPDIVDLYPEYIGFLDKWTLDVDGEKEDCIRETIEWYNEHGLQLAMG